MLNWHRLAMVLLTALTVTAGAGTGRIKKVLPHYLDKAGRDSLAPSLYERDAYQAQLRRTPAERSALRFDVLWKASGMKLRTLQLRVEIRGGKEDGVPPIVIEGPVTVRSSFSRWSSVTLEGEKFAGFGELIAWRATLWDGNTQVAEQKSFLW